MEPTILEEPIRVDLGYKICNKHRVAYVYESPFRDWGRLYSLEECSLQDMTNYERRKYLRGVNYKHIQLISSFPMALVYFCKKEGIDCTMWEYYIENEEMLLQNLSKYLNYYDNPIKKAKRMFYECLFNKIDSSVPDIDLFMEVLGFLRPYMQEAERIKRSFFQNDKYIDIANIALEEVRYEDFRLNYYNTSYIHKQVETHFMYLLFTKYEQIFMKQICHVITNILDREIFSYIFDSVMFYDNGEWENIVFESLFDRFPEPIVKHIQSFISLDSYISSFLPDYFRVKFL